MNINEKLEELNIDKGQIIIFSVIGLIILFMAIGLLSPSEDDSVLGNNNLEIPKNKAVTDYDTKMEAYAKENEIKENKTSLNFDRNGVFGSDSTEIAQTKREQLEAKVDSMFNITKRENYKNNSNVSVTDKVRKNKIIKQAPIQSAKPIIIDKPADDNNIDITDFFSNTPTVEKIANLETKSTLNSPIVKVVIHNDQEIKNNERVSLRLTNDYIINGTKYKKNTFLYGFAKFSKNRIFLTVNNINNNKVLYNAFDSQDGNLGIYIEGANALGEVKQQGIDESIQDSDLDNVPLGRTLKNVFRRKNRETSVLLMNNYEIILKTVQ